jgi:hypothetical protein
MANNNFEDREGSNINFDGRMGRTKVLTALLVNLTDAQFNDDIKRWYKSLRSLYYICAPYVSKVKADKVKQAIKEADNRIKLVGNTNTNLVYISLDKATELSMFTFKDQFLLSQSDDMEEFDVRKILED